MTNELTREEHDLVLECLNLEIESRLDDVQQGIEPGSAQKVINLVNSAKTKLIARQI